MAPQFDFNAAYGNLQPGMMGGANPSGSWMDKYNGTLATQNPLSSSSGGNSFDDFMKFSSLGGVGSGIGSLLGGLFGGKKNPMSEANKYYDQVPGAISPYYNPYIDAGRNALSSLQGQFGQLTNDPNAVYNKLAGGFHESPGFKWQMGQGMNAASNAAASGGMLGTPAHQQEAATMAEGLANQDFQNYLNHVSGLYGTGLTGLQGINQQGYGASHEMAQNLANLLMNQGNMAYSNAASRNQERSSNIGDIFGGLGSLASLIFM